MHDKVPEADWRVFREILPVALDRYCRRALDEVAEIVADTTQSEHARFEKIARLVRDRQRDLERNLVELRRSSMRRQLRQLHTRGVLEPEEIARFGEETRAVIELEF